MNYSEYEKGLLIGLFSVQGSFGGDGKVPHLIIRAGESQFPLLEKITNLIPGSNINGPYDNRGSTYYQWSVRGEALLSFLLTGVLADLERLSPSQFEKMNRMQQNYFRGESLRFRTRPRRTQKRPES